MAKDKPEPPDELKGYDPGSARDAMATDDDTDVVWVADHEREKRWWFEIRERIPVRKKGSILETNTTATEDGVNVSADYYTDMLEYMIVDWSGGDDADAPSLREFLTKAYRGSDPDNPVFETLQDEVPPPFANVPEAEVKE